VNKSALAWLMAACACAAASAKTPAPSSFVTVPTLAATDKPAHGFARLRIHLTSKVSSGEPVSLASVAACSASACFEATLRRQVAVTTTADGSGSFVADLELPFMQLASLRFRSSERRGALDGSVTLATAFALQPGFAGGDVLVVIDKSGEGFRPLAATANFLSNEGRSVYYNPAVATRVGLPHRVMLDIPAGALDAPQIFLVGVYTTSDQGPFVDIYPALKLARPARIELRSNQRVTRPVRETGFVDLSRRAAGRRGVAR
jgi:hypothetical protein